MITLWLQILENYDSYPAETSQLSWKIRFNRVSWKILVDYAATAAASPVAAPAAPD